MSWNYRVIKTIYSDPNETAVYQIHEVYYNSAGEIEGYTSSPVAPYGETKDELIVDWDMMRDAFNKPALIEKDGKLIEDV